MPKIVGSRSRRAVTSALFGFASAVAMGAPLFAADDREESDGPAGRRDEIEKLMQSMLPQLTTADQQSALTDISFPLGADILVALVTDKQKDAEYLKRSDVAAWSNDPKGLLVAAINNLGLLVDQWVIPISGQRGARYLAMQQRDGFDAARILVPTFREFFAKQVGLPYWFVIPNRDVLVCWDRRNAANFQTLVRSEATREFKTHPHPLTDKVFEMTKKFEIRLADE